MDEACINSIYFRFWYEVLKRKYGDNLKLCFTDTDSFLFSVKTRDIYNDLAEEDLKPYFDFSNYNQAHPLHDSTKTNIPGLFKDETEGEPIREFVGLRSKLYSIAVGATGNEYQKQASAGVKTVLAKRHLQHRIYKNILLSHQQTGKFAEFSVDQRTIRSFNHRVFNVKQSRIALSNIDDKRFVLDDNITTRAHGHFANDV